MIRNTTYNVREVKEAILDDVGKPFSVFRRIRMGGNGSQRYVIVEAFDGLDMMLSPDHGTRFCNIELREKGIILHFRSRLETYAWTVPYRLLSLFKSDDNTISIYSGAEFVRLKPAHHARLNMHFLNKMLELKKLQNAGFQDITQR